MPQSPSSRRQHPHEKPPIAPGAESSAGTESGTELPMPHERDESADTAAEPDPAMRQAHDDLAAGQVDTDMRGTPGLDAQRRERLVPGAGGRSRSD